MLFRSHSHISHWVVCCFLVIVIRKLCFQKVILMRNTTSFSLLWLYITREIKNHGGLYSIHGLTKYNYKHKNEEITNTFRQHNSFRDFLKKTSRLAAATTKRRSPNMLGQISWLRLCWLASLYKGTWPVEFTCAPSLLLSPLIVASCPTSTSKLASKCWEKRWGVALFSRSSPSSPAGAKCQNSAGAKCAGAGA